MLLMKLSGCGQKVSLPAWGLISAELPAAASRLDGKPRGRDKALLRALCSASTIRALTAEPGNPGEQHLAAAGPRCSGCRGRGLWKTRAGAWMGDILQSLTQSCSSRTQREVKFFYQACCHSLGWCCSWRAGLTSYFCVCLKLSGDTSLHPCWMETLCVLRGEKGQLPGAAPSLQR